MERRELRTTPQFVRKRAKHYLKWNLIIFVVFAASGALLFYQGVPVLHAVGCIFLLFSSLLLLIPFGNLGDMLWRSEQAAKAMLYVDESRLATFEESRWQYVDLTDIESIKTMWSGRKIRICRRRRILGLVLEKDLNTPYFERRELEDFLACVRQAAMQAHRQATDERRG
ncbi:MAG: hypothetical protein ABSA67_03370 [Candidatus Brocadiia bacterium]|jgi:hypothetical protein